jgi:phosphoribosylformylglycinamidine cyclo-ligase
MGIGFCVIAPKEEETKIISIAKRHNLPSRQIGKIIEKKGVFVNSKKIS